MNTNKVAVLPVRRREFISLAAPFLLTGCIDARSTPGTLASSELTRRRTLQVSLIVGAALGAAIARDRGGAVLAGAAIGAFAGAAVASAVQYARLLLNATNGDVAESYSLLANSAAEDRVTFSQENLPLLQAREDVSSTIVSGRSDGGSIVLIGRLNELERLEAERTVPTRIYVQAVPVYKTCIDVLPTEAGQSELAQGEQDQRGAAEVETNALEQVVLNGLEARRRADARLASIGVRL